MIDQKLLNRMKNHNFTLKHISQAEIDKISKINFTEFLFWLGKDNITIKNAHYCYSNDENITLYKEIAYNHYIGINYPPLFFYRHIWTMITDKRYIYSTTIITKYQNSK